MQIALPKLPYQTEALEPLISRQTLEIHHGKHHRAYVEKTQAMAKEIRLADQPLEKIIAETADKPHRAALFNNAAQAWNHAFYWRSLRPAGGDGPSGALEKALASAFGSTEAFAKEFKAAAAGQFGSGWAWLIADQGALKITTTSNADTPLAHGQVPLLTVDVWEHAYYLDYQNRRPDYLAAVVDKLIDWSFASQNFEKSQGGSGPAPLSDN